MKSNTTPQSFNVTFPAEMAARIRFLAALEDKTPEAYIAAAMVESTTCHLESVGEEAAKRRPEVNQAVDAVQSGAVPVADTPESAGPVVVTMTERQREYLRALSRASRFTEGEILLGMAFTRLDAIGDGPWIGQIHAAVTDYCTRENLPSECNPDEISPTGYAHAAAEETVAGRERGAS